MRDKLTRLLEWLLQKLQPKMKTEDDVFHIPRELLSCIASGVAFAAVINDKHRLESYEFRKHKLSAQLHKKYNHLPFQSVSLAAEIAMWRVKHDA